MSKAYQKIAIFSKVGVRKERGGKKHNSFLINTKMASRTLLLERYY